MQVIYLKKGTINSEGSILAQFFQIKPMEKNTKLNCFINAISIQM